MAKSGSQVIWGKAFEFACAEALYEAFAERQPTAIVSSPELDVARDFFEQCAPKHEQLMSAARAAVRVLDRLEPCLGHASSDAEPLLIRLQPDKRGEYGDVRDVLCSRLDEQWAVGLSCKHNHHAVKHSRLSDRIDFGSQWVGYPCSSKYFSQVVPIFEELRALRDNGRTGGRRVRWSDFPDKEERYYAPILSAFIQELKRLNRECPDVPERLIRYLMGRLDFYKVIADDAHRSTRIEAVNTSGSLGRPAAGRRPITAIPLLRMPRRIYYVDFMERENGEISRNTVHVVCDNGWELSMRLHNASTYVEPSLKFDVQLISLPGTVFSQVEPWDY